MSEKEKRRGREWKQKMTGKGQEREGEMERGDDGKRERDRWKREKGRKGEQRDRNIFCYC